MESLPATGSRLLVHGPVYLAMLMGVIVALSRWDRHPRTSPFAVASVRGLLLLGLAGLPLGRPAVALFGEPGKAIAGR